MWWLMNNLKCNGTYKKLEFDVAFNCEIITGCRGLSICLWLLCSVFVQGHIEPLSEEILTIKYLPSGPQKFHSSFQIQVAHFEPDSVNIYGEGVFPRLTLDLPRAGDEDGTCERLLAKAKDKLTKEMNRKFNRPTSCVSETDEALAYGQIQVRISYYAPSILLFLEKYM